MLKKLDFQVASVDVNHLKKHNYFSFILIIKILKKFNF